jgi:hypothetical protein
MRSLPRLLWRCAALTGALLSALAAPVAAPVAASVAVADPAGPTVTLDQQRITATIGQVLTIESVIGNPGPGSTERMVAHLNVASLDGRYVDLEDWSGDVTKVVDPLPAGENTSVEWEFQAVNSGDFAVYVTLVPGTGRGPVIAGDPVHVTVAARRALNSGGVLPVAIAVPAVLGLLVAVTGLRLRRTR